MSDSYVTALPYPADSAAWFCALRDLPYPLLFDSASSPVAQGRFDILCADPVAMLCCRLGSVTLTENGRSQHTDEQPLAVIRRLLTRYPSNPCDLDGGWPFTGGLAGYFGYDYGRALEGLPARAGSDYAAPELAVGLYRWAIVIDHASRRAALLSLQELDNTYRQDLLDRLANPKPAGGNDFRLLAPFASNLDRQAYGDAFRRVMEYILAGDCYQVNLSQRLSSHYQGDPWQAFRQLTDAMAPSYAAYFEGPDWTVLSLSPEAFLHVDGGRVVTSPIKGTSARGKTAVEDEALRRQLGNSSKDRAENLIIVDLLRNDLGKSCQPGSIRVEKLWNIETFPYVHHLVSTISGILREDQDALDLLAGSFPGGSITGAPKHRAMQIIDELEPTARSVYCGSFAYIGPDGRMASNIAIRTILCETNRIHCWAGGGIVADSDEEAEYRECETKIGRILEVLQTIN